MNPARLLPPPGLRSLVLLFALAVCCRGQTRIEVTGNRHFGADSIRRTLPPSPQDGDRREWETWTARASLSVEERYREEGFLDARARTRRMPGDTVSVRIHEGRRYRFGRVRVEAPADPPVPEAAQALEKRPGEVFDLRRLREDARLLLAAYRDLGHVRARIGLSADRDSATGTVDVVHTVDPGPLARLDSLVIRNFRDIPGKSVPGLTQPSLLRSLVDLRPEDPVRGGKLRVLADRLLETGVFSLVNFSDSLAESLPDRLSDSRDDRPPDDPSPTAGADAADPGEERRVLILEAVERPPGTARFSIRWEAGYGPGVHGALGHRNLGGRFWEAWADGSVAVRKQEVSLRLGRPLPFGLPVRVDAATGYRWRQDLDVHGGVEAPWFEGDEDGHAALWASHAPLPWLRLAIGGSYRALRLDRGLGDPYRDAGTSALGSAEAFFLDVPMDPTRGLRLETTGGIGGLPDGGTSRSEVAPHGWLQGTLAGYYPFRGEASILAGRLGGGSFFGEAGIESDRFFLGGPRSVRGFREGEICPEIQTVETPKGSASACARAGLEPAFLLVSGEWRMKPVKLFVQRPGNLLKKFKEFRAVPFADFGLVWNRMAGGPESGTGAVALGTGWQFPVMGFVHLRLDLAAAREEGQPWFFAWALALNQAF